MDNLARQLQRQRQTDQDGAAPRKVQHKTQSKQSRITRGEKWIVAAMACAIIAACLLVITNYANIYAQEREITTLNHEISQQADVNDSLQLQVSELRAPERIMYYAKEELGMELNDDQVKVIQKSSTP
ncbi:cell division protein FtsL [Alteribacillus persepolensis]|uniref:Cell division protein FtsL n=1 Tax=Alteribacillus persepolensis TaxID=568899 RepID=A0A1G7YF74_9BACI|nr:cell division protein FtsL [Alteribacillus persepolensis]SDG94919.1 cell division protein FtsL [Alteribacillus persepolensis]